MSDDTTKSVRTVKRAYLTDSGVNLTTNEKDAATTAFALEPLPSSAHTYLSLLGLKTALLTADDAEDAYAALMAGKLPEHRSAAAPKVSKRREAIAHALAHAQAKAVLPQGAKKIAIEAEAAVHLPAMMLTTASLTKEEVGKLIARADVDEHYKRLFGPKMDQAAPSLLDIVGLGVPAAA